MQTALSGVCAGLPLSDNYLFWASLFLGLGAGCASMLAALAYFVAIVKNRAFKGEVSRILPAAAGTAMFVLTILGFFAVAVVVRVVKVNVPGASGIGLLAFTIGLLVTLTAHILTNRNRLKL